VVFFFSCWSLVSHLSHPRKVPPQARAVSAGSGLGARRPTRSPRRSPRLGWARLSSLLLAAIFSIIRTLEGWERWSTLKTSTEGLSEFQKKAHSEMSKKHRKSKRRDAVWERQHPSEQAWNLTPQRCGVSASLVLLPLNYFQIVFFMTSVRFLAVLLDCQNILWHPQDYSTDWFDNCKVFLFSDGFNRLQKCPRFGLFFVFLFFFFNFF